MATDSNTTLDIEQLNALATRLRDDYVDNVRNPALAKDLDTAADVAVRYGFMAVQAI